MGKEIEPRYLLKSWPEELLDLTPEAIEQGYLSADPQRTVRIRVIADQGKLTVKGIKVELEAPEFEYDILKEDAAEMLKLCIPGSVLLKDRFYYPTPDGLTWEVDKFRGNLTALFIAEAELKSKETSYVLPDVFINVGAVDVSRDFRFANSELGKLTPTEIKALINDAFAKYPLITQPQ